MGHLVGFRGARSESRDVGDKSLSEWAVRLG